MMSEHETVLKDENSCPNCGASGNNIDWDGPDVQDCRAIYNGHCDICECDFSQENKLVYVLTTWTN